MAIKNSLKNQKILTFGGGTGQFYVLSGLRDLIDPSYITAVSGNWDSGGSSGKLRTELGVLPPGDLRRCILALMEDSAQRQVAQRLFDDRLEEVSGPLKGHSLGNLISVRLDHIFRGQDRGTNAVRALFRIRAQILPASLTDLELVALTHKGIVLEGETNIDLRKTREDFEKTDPILRIYFNTKADANPQVLEAIKHADRIVFSPGDLFTSVLPHLLVEGVQEALLATKAKIIFVMNLMTKSGETDFYQASDHLRHFLYYLGDPNRLDYVLINDNHLDPQILEIYRTEGQEPVELDEETCKQLAPKAKLIKKELAKYMRKEHLLRHDPIKLATALLEI